MYTIMLFICISLFGLLGKAVSQADPIVNTLYGTLRGTTNTVKGVEYDEFLGVPFALPPLGELRFQRPLPPAPWQGIRDAKAQGPACTQTEGVGLLFDEEISEDCLNLDIYIPGKVDSNNKIPVMIWIHGGGFMYGSKNVYASGELAVTGEVLVVTINYRLGSLGFLSTVDENSVGNYGLWDMIQALDWVQKNIAAFGGDPDRVTLFGESAGGAATSYLAISPQARGLFHRIISTSGSASAPWGINYLPQRISRNTGIAYGCDYWDPRLLVECLSQEEPDNMDLYTTLATLLINQHNALMVPTIDRVVVPDDPRVLYEEGANADYDLMHTYLPDESAGTIFFQNSNVAATPEGLQLFMRYSLNIWRNPEELIELLYDHNTDLSSPDLQTRTRAAIDGASLHDFIEPLLNEVQWHSRNAESTGRNTYLSEIRYLASWYQGDGDRFPGYDVGAIHADDLSFIFGEKFINVWVGNNTVITPQDQRVMENVMKYFSNFAYTGNPNDGPHKLDVSWPEFDDNTQERLIMDADLTTEKLPLDLLQELDFYRNQFYPARQPFFPHNKATDNVSSNMAAMITKEMLNELKAEYFKSPYRPPML